MTESDTATAGHRAIYVLEMGVWRATCRTCGHSVTDPRRRRAVTIFRNHIRDAGSATVPVRSAEPPTTDPTQTTS